MWLMGVRLNDLVFNMPVTVDTDKQDRYGSDVGEALVNGQGANLEQINRGLEWHYTAYERERQAIDRKVYAEQKAAPKPLGGAWGLMPSLCRWDFRHNK